MRDIILHVPSGTPLDLAVPDFGTGDGQAIIDECYGHGSRNPPLLVCEKHRAPLYLQKRKTHDPGSGALVYALFGVHFDAQLTSHHISTGVSDEHKRQTDYIVRAAEAAGHKTETEVRLRSSRPDAVLYGPALAVGAEVQRSQLSRKQARTRTIKAKDSGLTTSVWFNDKEKLPSWFFHVPSIGMNALPWDVVPPRRAVTVTTGLRQIRPLKCGTAEMISRFGRCPKRKRGGPAWCNGFHIAHEPWHGMTVDDVAELAPAGRIVELPFMGKEWLLVSRYDRDVYEDIIGRPIDRKANVAPDREGRPRTRIEDQSDIESMCCGERSPGELGRPVVPACALCPKSPTYWRTPSKQNTNEE